MKITLLLYFIKGKHGRSVHMSDATMLLSEAGQEIKVMDANTHTDEYISGFFLQSIVFHPILKVKGQVLVEWMTLLSVQRGLQHACIPFLPHQ